MNKRLILSLTVVAVFSAKAALAEKTVKIDGSSTVFPITEAVAEEFQKDQKSKAKKGEEVRVTVGISGTGGGFKKFCRGETDVQDASRPILREEMAACKAAGIQYYELPVAFDALTVAVSKRNTWANDITVEELKKLWEPAAQGKITRWNQVRASWPNEPIQLYGAGSDSGTFDYFTEAVVGKAKSSRGDYTASEDDNTIVQGIVANKNALGYLPFSYYQANLKTMKALAIQGGEKAPSKKPVAPSKETVENGTYFPLSRPIFIYVSSSAAAKPEVQEFTHFYLRNASNLAKQVNYVSLPAKAYTLALKNVERKKLGTVFGGTPEVGLKIEKLLEREIRE